MPLSKIGQTSKVLLLEEFFPSAQAGSLDTLIRGEDVRSKNSFVKKMEDKLEVRSFEEFVKKFMPTIWTWCEATNDPQCPVECRCSLEKPAHIPDPHQMPLDQNEFYGMVMDLYSKKSLDGKANLEFDYSSVEELLSPQHVLKNAKQMRRDLKYLHNELNKLPETAKTERRQHEKKFKKLCKNIVIQWLNNPLAMIKLALADTQAKLAALDAPQQRADAPMPEAPRPALPCRISFSENGEIDVELLEPEIQPMRTPDDGSRENELATIVGRDFDKYGGEDNPYLKSIVISNYCGDQSLTPVLDPEILLERKRIYMNIYQKSEEAFIRAISTAVEKLLSVKIFFDQACAGKAPLPAPVIVANCKASALVENEKVKADFEFLITENLQEVTERHIWFAIVPAVGDEGLLDDCEDDDEDDDELYPESRQKNAKMRTRGGEELVSLETLKQAVDILSKGRITTFFSYRANERTGFEALSLNLVESYKRKLKEIDTSYGVFCYPNFTILPKKEACIEIGREGRHADGAPVLLDIPGIYVDAAYVAAGLVVGTQNPEYLKKHGFEVKPNMPCVRFDLEEKDYRFHLQTTMNREGLTAWPRDVEDCIGKDMFGFCFCGNDKLFQGKMVRNTYVYNARSLRRDRDGDGAYEPLYTQLTMDFISQFLKLNCSTFGGSDQVKAEDYNQFAKAYLKEWNLSREEAFVNRLLHEGEKLDKTEGGRLAIVFNGREKTINIEIVKGTKEETK